MAVALVTGAARRIGLKIAERLAAAGYDLALHSSEASYADAKEVAARLARSGTKTFAVAADLLDPAAPARIVSAAANALGPLSLLVNNASIFEDDDAFS
ncbi:MAG: SDR family NAD(P)-dependent oxidoreductase, partial [Xanthobacteraceae bacterium]